MWQLSRQLAVSFVFGNSRTVAVIRTMTFVATERNELKDENTTLQAETSQLQKELQGRSSYNPTWSNNINSMTPTQPQPTATGLPMLHQPVANGSTQATPIRQLQHFSGGKNKHSTTNAAWSFPGDETTCRISDFVGLGSGLLLWTSHQYHKKRDVVAVALVLAARRKDVIKHPLVYHYNQEMYIANPIIFSPFVNDQNEECH
nr:PREDICTED: uncharacterized protein LOC103976109 isoform X1 [Musa acuminata subsp. malaccensis]XP_018677511.1 PREDICTED: uncharacterized protein LOC103976109 isoform X1 [Musa acuminata subsp. malaccensis]